MIATKKEVIMRQTVKLTVTIKPAFSDVLSIDGKIKAFKEILNSIEIASERLIEYGICSKSFEFEFEIEDNNLYLIKNKISDVADYFDSNLRYKYKKCS